LIAATVAMYFITESSPRLVESLAFIPSRALQRPWTVVTYMFLHAGLGHLFFNMLALFMFGPHLERRLGGKRFLGLYFVGGVAGALLSLGTRGAIIGASAATFAVSLGFARYWPNAVILVWGILPVKAWFMVAAMTALALLGAGGLGSQGVAHLAHLGGFVGGWLYLRTLESRTGAAAFRAQAVPQAGAVSDADVARWRGLSLETLHPVNREEYERVLKKLESEGSASLTGDERAFLDRFATS
jgi:membrane associated rhomboid family serine protease